MGEGAQVPAMSWLQHHALRSTTTKVHAARARLARCAGIARDVHTGSGNVIATELADDGSLHRRWRPATAR